MYGTSICTVNASLTSFDSTALYVLLSEESRVAKGTANGNFGTDDAYINATTNYIANRHFDGSNVLFLDSPVKSMRSEPTVLAQSVFSSKIKVGGNRGCSD